MTSSRLRPRPPGAAAQRGSACSKNSTKTKNCSCNQTRGRTLSEYRWGAFEQTTEAPNTLERLRRPAYSLWWPSPRMCALMQPEGVEQIFALCGADEGFSFSSDITAVGWNGHWSVNKVEACALKYLQVGLFSKQIAQRGAFRGDDRRQLASRFKIWSLEREDDNEGKHVCCHVWAALCSHTRAHTHTMLWDSSKMLLTSNLKVAAWCWQAQDCPHLWGAAEPKLPSVLFTPVSQGRLSGLHGTEQQCGHLQHLLHRITIGLVHVLGAQLDVSRVFLQPQQQKWDWQLNKSKSWRANSEKHVTMNSATALIKRTRPVSVLMSVGISAVGSYLCGHQKRTQKQQIDCRKSLTLQGIWMWKRFWGRPVPLHKPHQDFCH